MEHKQVVKSEKAGLALLDRSRKWSEKLRRVKKAEAKAKEAKAKAKEDEVTCREL